MPALLFNLTDFADINMKTFGGNPEGLLILWGCFCRGGGFLVKFLLFNIIVIMQNLWDFAN